MNRLDGRSKSTSNTGGQLGEAIDSKTLLLFSDDLDRVLAAFVIAIGAAAMDSQVTIFFAFWGLNALRRQAGPTGKKDLLGRLSGG